MENFTPEFLICSQCNRTIVSERTRFDPRGKPYHEVCFVEHENKNNNNKPVWGTRRR